MGTSERTFNQVKDILAKLDRSIDRAREKRLDVKQEVPQSRDEAADRPIGRARPLRPSPGTAFQRLAGEG